MRRYDDPVDVRRGRVAGAGDGSLLVEGPEQFLWRGRLWRVSAVVAHWGETGAWWEADGVHAALGADAPNGGPGGGGTEDRPDRSVDLSAERELWRVEADRGRSPAPVDGRPGRG